MSSSLLTPLTLSVCRNHGFYLAMLSPSLASLLSAATGTTGVVEASSRLLALPSRFLRPSPHRHVPSLLSFLLSGSALQVGFLSSLLMRTAPAVSSTRLSLISPSLLVHQISSCWATSTPTMLRGILVLTPAAYGYTPGSQRTPLRWPTHGNLRSSTAAGLLSLTFLSFLAAVSSHPGNRSTLVAIATMCPSSSQLTPPYSLPPHVLSVYHLFGYPLRLLTSTSTYRRMCATSPLPQCSSLTSRNLSPPRPSPA